MLQKGRLLLLCLHLLLMTNGQFADAEDQQQAVTPISRNVTRYLKTYCVRCHGPDEQNADVRLDTMPTTIPDGTVALQWQDVLDVLNLGQMPPEGEPRPPKEQAAAAIEALTANLLEARERLTDTGGHVVLRRLNRREYRKTIDVLFGVPVDVSMLPDDATVDGFDTLGQAQSFSSLSLERYLDIGRRVLDQAYDFRAIKRRKPYHFVEESEKRISHELSKELPKLEQKIKQYDKSIGGGKKSHIPRREITRLEVELTREYLDRAETQNGALVPFRGLSPYAWASFNGSVPVGTYRVRVRCGIAADKPVDSYYMKVVRGQYRSKVPDAIDYYHITGTTSEPQVVEFTVDVDHIRSNRLEFSRRDVRPQRLERYAEIRDYIFKFPKVAVFADNTRPDLWIDSIELEGPLPRTEPTLSAMSLFNNTQPKDLDSAGARKIIERFAFEAFRHQLPEPKYVDQLVAIFDASRARDVAPIDALKDALSVVLASPRFLFLDEPKESDERRKLTDRELACRLSYFLWSAPPDEELYRLADAKRLHDPAVFAEQVDRIIASPRSAAFVETFSTGWLELDHLDRIDPEATPSPAYDDAVHRHSRREVFALFERLLRENRPATDLIDADYVVVNSLLADFYELEGVHGDEFRPVSLLADSPRGGLLGQSSILALTGTGQRTSPVDRGAYVLRKLLDRAPPPAPANVPTLNEEEIGSRSIRETLSIHQSNPQCASCHRRIDPLGFALENFDPVGRWRERVTNAEGDEFPIDPRGVMPDGKRTINGPTDLKRNIMEDRNHFLRGLTESLMTYALGRTIGFSDRELVDQIVATTAENHDYRLRSLVHEIIRSRAFQMR